MISTLRLSMAYTRDAGIKAVCSKRFTLFLFGQGISNLGDAFQFIAATSLLVKITGSGLTAAFGLICYPVLSILLSTLAGYICDTRNEKVMLIIIDILRGLAAILFISKQSTLQIYALIIILSTLDIFYSPPKRKFMSGILENDMITKGNSLLNGVAGVMFIIGPILAGIVITTFGTEIAFFFNGISFLVSAFSIWAISYRPPKPNIPERSGQPAGGTINSLMEGVEYSFKNYMLRRIILIGSILCLATASVNFAFYPFAFNVLMVSDKLWATMISVFYGSNLIGTAISLFASFRMSFYYRVVIPLSMMAISIIWFNYAGTFKIPVILLLQLAEGTILSYLGIVLTSHLQILSKHHIMGRVVGVNDFVNNLGKVLGIGISYLLIKIAWSATVFSVFAMIVFLFALYSLLWTKGERLDAACTKT